MQRHRHRLQDGQWCMLRTRYQLRDRHSRPKTSMAGSRTPGQTKLLDLTQWAIAKGIKYAKVRPQEFSGLRGMAATFDVNKGDALVSVPQQASLRVYAGEFRHQTPETIGFCHTGLLSPNDH